MAPVNTTWRVMNEPVGPEGTYVPTDIEHSANILTHAVGIPIAGCAMYTLMTECANAKECFVSLVYGIAMNCLFLFSTAYHCAAYWHKQARIKFWLHLLDRGTIYGYIASAYYPWLALKDCGILGYYMQDLVWVLAGCGIVYQYNFIDRYHIMDTTLYVLMGLLPGLPICFTKNYQGIEEILIGGFFYLTGVLIFHQDGTIPFAHAIWHVHVVIGSYIHFRGVVNHLLKKSEPYSSHKKIKQP